MLTQRSQQQRVVHTDADTEVTTTEGSENSYIYVQTFCLRFSASSVRSREGDLTVFFDLLIVSEPSAFRWCLSSFKMC